MPDSRRNNRRRAYRRRSPRLRSRSKSPRSRSPRCRVPRSRSSQSPRSPRSRSPHSRSPSLSRSRPRYRSHSRSRSPKRYRHHRDRSRSHSPLTKRFSRTIFLMQLSSRTNSRDLDDFFSPVGRVREVRLIMDSKTRKHRGVAYVEFEHSSSVDKAMSLNGTKLNGAPILIQPSNADKNNPYDSHPNFRYSLPPNSLRVYVGGMHPSLTEDMLRALFEPFGEILRIEMMKDHVTGQSKGYAFITFADMYEACEAIVGLNGVQLGGKALKVSKCK